MVNTAQTQEGLAAERPQLREIDEQSVSELVDRFYARVRQDDVIGPIFNESVENWDAHLALLKDFWGTVLLAQGRYKGNPMLAHFNLPIREHFFDRWLGLFNETARDIFVPEAADKVVGRATQIAANMRRVLPLQQP